MLKNWSIKIYVLLAIMGCFICISSYACAEIKNINATGQYTMGEGETISIAKERALQDALRNASESAGVYVSSYSKLHNLTLVDDEVETLSSSILKLVSKDYDTPKSFQENGGISMQIVAHICAQVDTDEILILNEKFKENKDLKNKYDTLQNQLIQSQNELNSLKNKIKDNGALAGAETLRIVENEEKYNKILSDINAVKRKLTLNYDIQPLNNALYRLNRLNGNWYNSSGDLVLTINNGYINGCKVICGLSAGDAYGYRIKQSNGNRDMGLVIDCENYKGLLWIDESTILRHSVEPVYTESISGLYIGMSKKYLLAKYGVPTRIEYNPDARGIFPWERWFYSELFSVFFLDDMAAEVTVYDKSAFRFDKTGLSCAEGKNILKQTYGLGQWGEIAVGEYIKFDDEHNSVILTSYKF